MTHKIIVDERGFIRCVHNDRLPLHELGPVKMTRIGTITPAFAPIKGPLFWLLRKLFGDRGRVAAYTRKWKGPWLVKMLRCGEWSVFEARSSAVKWEQAHLNSCDQCNISNPARFDV